MIKNKSDDETSVVSEAVRAKLKSLEKMIELQSNTDSLKEASKLADKYSHVEPEISKMPLDAMAGFPWFQSKKNAL